MPDYSDHKAVIRMIEDAQSLESHQREAVQEAHDFIDVRGGQWEADISKDHQGPEYTFDMTSSLVDQVAGEMEQANFEITVKPSGGEASKDVAQLYNGLIRNIQSVSNSDKIYNTAGRSMVTGGLDGWRVVQKHTDSDSFDQDLAIEKISNFSNRVWFDPSSEEQDRSDSRWCVVLQSIATADYQDMWPEGSESSVSDGALTTSSFCVNDNDDVVTVGELLYIKKISRTLILMSNGATYDEKELEPVADELARLNITEEKRRDRPKHVVFSRKFDNDGWLEEEKETVFEFIPVIPTYANFKIVRNQARYFGLVEKEYDAQRVLNYSLTREVSEGALAPRSKYWMTETQMAGHEDSLGTLNTNNEPVQTFSVDPESPTNPPIQQGGAQINQGLRVISQAMEGMMAKSAGLHAASLGNNPGLQSGVAIEKLQAKGDIGTIKYFSPQEIAICHTARILISAIPRVYEEGREVRILGEDGSFDMKTLGEKVIDEQTGKEVTLHDLSSGQYDVTCSAGEAFQSRMQETAAKFIEMMQIDPSIIQTGGDILFNSLSGVGMDQLAERKRIELFNAGAIPEEQMTEEEKQKLQEAQSQAANQPPQEDPMLLAAQAEMQKAQASLEKNQIEFQKAQIDAQLKAGKQQLEQQKQEFELLEKQAKFNQDQAQADFDNQLKASQHQSDIISQALKDGKTEAETLKIIREAIGVETIVGPNNMQAYIGQAKSLNESVGDVTET